MRSKPTAKSDTKYQKTETQSKKRETVPLAWFQ